MNSPRRTYLSLRYPSWLSVSAVACILSLPFRAEAQGSGLIAYWPFDGNFINSVTGVSSSLMGNGSTYAPGYKNQALNPNGGWAQVNETWSLGARTITAWVNAGTSTNGNPIITMANSTNLSYDFFGIGSFIGYAPNCPQYAGQLYIEHWPGPGYPHYCYISSATLSRGSWSHVALVWDDSGSLTVYVNGSAASFTGSLFDQTTDSISIGGNGNVGVSSMDFSFSGLIDEFQIYNRALSSGEVQSIMNNGLIQAPSPSFNPNGGTFSTSPYGVTIHNTGFNNGVNLRFTGDGTTPSHTNGTLGTSEYTYPQASCASPVLKAIGYGSWYLDSTVVTAIYSFNAGTVAAPTFSVGGGTYVTPQTVTLSSATSGATIRYTLDGSTPSETSGTIGTSVTVSSTATLKAIAYLGCPYIDSSVTSATYTITGTVATPTFNPAGGTYSGAQTVTISTTTPGASIHYTTDGSTPTEGHGTTGTSVTVRSTETLKAMAFESGWLDSSVATASYTITGTATQPNPPPVGTPGADSGNGMDPRRIGVRPFGSYWGAAGENIDTTSGNLNFSIPLFKVLSRGGWGVNFALSYNSQMWRQDSAGTWLLGGDVGYGLGWTLQAGSIVPIWSSTSTIDHYLYTDSTGAEYSLSTNTNGVWTGREGVYISFDTNTNRLYFNDGSFWVMGAQSAGGEQDAGTLYPTLMQDSNGNQITILYTWGAGGGGLNTSARICAIFDPRDINSGGGQIPCSGGGFSHISYYFTYNSDAVPHAANLTSFVGTAESYNFYYAANQSLNSPFAPSIYYGPTTFLQTVGVSGLGVAHNFQYASTGTGELTQVTTPLGGTLQWQYRSFAYGSGISLREVQTRQMASVPGGTSNSWAFTYDGTSSPTYHASTSISDAGAGTSKTYYVSTQNLNNQTVTTLLPYAYAEFNSDGTQPLQIAYTWLEENGNVHKYTEATTLNPNTPNAATKTTYQYRDAYGSLTASYVYNFGNTSGTSDWAYTLTYLTDPNYLSRYVRNRLTQATVTRGGVNTTLHTNTYDVYTSTPLTDRPNLGLHDSSYNTSFTYRGNVTSSGPDNHTASYDIGGVVTASTDGAGRTVTSSPNSSTSYSLPAVISNGNVSSNISYAGSWAVTSVVDSNGPSTNTTYDQFGRPTSNTVADGAVTNYTYTYNPNTQTATITHPPENPNGTTWKRTTLDGFGRTIKVESGHDSTTVSQVDTQYAPCACSPLGKLYRTSQPYAPGGTPVWTTNTYDGSGRPLTATAPDGSVTHYSYQGNQTTVSDPAGKWKTTVTDAQGNLKSVIEPNPAGGANFVTSYTYDGVNHLTSVTMARPEGTQTRTFQYSGPDLVSATNPENGTVTYTYNGAHQVVTRVDAKNQKTQYTYDGYGRLTEVQHFLPGTPSGYNEDLNQQWHYYYDTPIDSSYPATYTQGRLAAVTFAGASGYSFQYEYGYNAAGRTTMQRMVTTGLAANPVTLDATYAWDNEGRVTARTYPNMAGPGFAYQYDIMGRLNTLSEQVCTDYGSGCSWNPVTRASANYGVASELTSLSYYGYTETRTYNSLFQLTRQTVAGVFDTEYVFPTGQNNGQISATIDHISGQQVNYTYDALKRLTAAGTTGGTPWGEAYTYDGFGNLNSATVTQGSGVNWANASDPATNRILFWYNAYDANGNWDRLTPGATFYDVENRLTAASVSHGNCGGWVSYWYDPSGKRVVSQDGCINGSTGATLLFYDIFGKRIATFSCQIGATCGGPTPDVYFGSKLVGSNGVAMVTDRLGSVRANSNGERFTYFPYGYEQTSTADSRVKFGTYLQDAPSQDYADQRYYNPWYGRFNSPDPSKGVNPADPGSWNKYAYTRGDPINRLDPQGLCDTSADGPYFVTVCGDPGNDPLFSLNVGAGDGNYNLYLAHEPRTADLATTQYHVPGTGITVTNPTASILVNRTITGLKNALANDAGCASWLSTGSGSDDVRMSGGISGYLDNLRGIAGAALISDPTVAAISNISYIPGFSVLFNTQGGFFVGTGTIGMPTSSADLANTNFDSDKGRDFFLLHELGHLLGAPGFVSNDTSNALQKDNNDDLWRNCNKTIMSFSNVSGH